MIKTINVVLSRFGWLRSIRMCFYPATVFVTTPFYLAKTLWNCRVLIRRKREDHSHFSPFAGVDYLCYWVIASNLKRFGHSGQSPYLGLGNYPMCRFFQYSLFSLKPYWKASNLVLLTGMFGWLLAHLIWAGDTSIDWLFLIIILNLISTNFYGNLFALQNYNVLGWIFFPVGIFGILSHNWFIAALGWLLVSLGSFSAAFLGGMLCFYYSAANLTPFALLSFLPAFLNLSRQFLPFLYDSRGLASSLANVAKGLGIYKRGAKYRYTHSKKKIIAAAYFLLIYLQFLLTFVFLHDKLPPLFIAGLFIFLLNESLLLRFLDIQSIYMLLVSLATADVILYPDTRLLLSFWLLISPLPLLMPFPFMKKVLDIVPVSAPFSIKNLKHGMEAFLKEVKNGERVFMAFADPAGMFNMLFDGYRALLELPHYVASERNIHFMPDFWGVFELNYKNAGDHLWGRDIVSVEKHARRWKADYIVIYQKTGEKIKPEWENAGFEIINKFSWIDYASDLRNVRPYEGEPPDWWLLKVPFQLKKICAG